MNKDFFTKNIIFFIFLIPSISLFIASITDVSKMIIICNLVVFLFTAHVMFKAYAQRIVYRIGAVMLLLLTPMIILTVVPVLMIYFSDNYNPEYHNARMLNALLIIPSTFCLLLSLPCLSAIKTAYVGLETQADNIRIITGERSDYVSVDLRNNSFLVKDEFIFGKKSTSYKGINLSVHAIYSYLKENNKRLKDLTKDDIEVITMMSI